MANAPEKAAQYAYIVYHLFPCIYRLQIDIDE